jgi:hypothetical protein
MLPMRGFILRFTSTSILVLLIVLAISGLYALVWYGPGWVMEVHRIGAWGIIALIPWKIGISWRSLKRGVGPRFDRSIMLGISLLMAVLAISLIIFALGWTWRIGPETFGIPSVLYQTIIGWHWILGLVLLAPLALHVWRRWPRPKPEEFAQRRGVMRLAGISVVGLGGWWIAEALAKARAEPQHPRRVSGSRLAGEFTGNDFPITSEAAPEIHIDTWKLNIGGAVTSPFSLTYDALLALPRTEWIATLDCTNGWWTTQAWQGVRLADLLDQAGMASNALSVRMISLTKYGELFTLAEAQQIMIATHVGGEPLSHWHGYPARGVAPFRRGWFWIKWLSEVKVLENVGEMLAHPLSIR